MAELAVLFNQYHHEEGVAEEFFGAETKMFKVRAYESRRPDDVKTEVLPYEKASDMIKKSGGGSLTMCFSQEGVCSARHS